MVAVLHTPEFFLLLYQTGFTVASIIPLQEALLTASPVRQNLLDDFFPPNGVNNTESFEGFEEPKRLFLLIISAAY